MRITDYHAKYFAYELTKRSPSNSPEKLSPTLSNAQVDLNPHQIDAALFALRSPLSMGVILADEVGLGKTIEAGLVISQKWAEGKRKILVVVPASLKKQWESELREKFFLPSQIMETPLFNKSNKQENPFGQKDKIIICSYHFASAKAVYLKKTKWDLVVIDEAHRLRNVWRPDNKMARKIRDALGKTHKLLLTATPLQNDLRELFGLVSILDENVFGDLKTFKKKYLANDLLCNSPEDLEKQKNKLEEDIADGKASFEDSNAKRKNLLRANKLSIKLLLADNLPFEQRRAVAKKVLANREEIEEGEKRLQEIFRIEKELKELKEKEPKELEDLEDLRQRLKPICKRTLRKDVPNIKFTERKCLLLNFELGKDEKELYEGLSDFLRHEELIAYAPQTRGLVRMILRKLLASSSFAIASTLRKTVKRLDDLLDDLKNRKNPQLLDEIPQEIKDDYESADELKEELEEDEDAGDGDEAVEHENISLKVTPIKADETQIKRERDALERLYVMAENIKRNTKADALLKALKTGFEQTSELGAKKKAVIFTESRVTQGYLEEFLSENGYSGKIGLLNGSLTSEEKQEAVERFRSKDEAELMIGTEAAAEGLNLQFCSLVVNYDLPWNPQRIEQRIGRCHRYGQQFNVVVVNFLHKGNAADERVYELLAQKFKLFEGVFGATDEILGSIQAGVNIGREISKIYECRTEEEREAASRALQEKLNSEISNKNKNAEKMIFGNLDEDVIKRLRKKSGEECKAYLDVNIDWWWKITRHYLGENAKYEDDEKTFELIRNPSFTKEWVVGKKYKIGGRTKDTSIFRPALPLAQRILGEVKDKETGDAEITFDYSSHHESKISAIQPMVGKSGVLKLSCLTVKTFEEEDALIVSACDELGVHVDPEIAKKFFALNGSKKNSMVTGEEKAKLKTMEDGIVQEYLHVAEERSKTLYLFEVEKRNKWLEDKKTAINESLGKLEGDLEALQNRYKKTENGDEKITLDRDIAAKKKELNKKRQDLWEQHGRDEEAKRKEKEKVKGGLKCKSTVAPLFTIRWKII